ncbi:TPA: hypothetical protein DIC21_00850 [Candidatus Uhrbacteria bacterium]|nr:hypothetical protein [Candidatus Uhrbacteria bacterium]
MTLDWRRIEKALRQEARQKTVFIDVPTVIDELQKLTSNFPDAWWSRSMCRKIGCVLMTQKQPIAIAPCCPDYTHDKGIYNFHGLNGGVSLLAEKHVAFLLRLQQTLPRINVLLLMADHEADDEFLCLAVGKSRKEFIGLVEESVRATRKLVEPQGWRVEPMTAVISDLVTKEVEHQRQLINSSETFQRLKRETGERYSMYDKIARAARKRMSFEEMMERTAKTAAQYLVMGYFTAEHHHLVVNHTTTNLGWYTETEAAIIHNPVKVY